MATKKTVPKRNKVKSIVALKALTTPTGRRRKPPASLTSITRKPIKAKPVGLKSVRAQQFGQLLQAALLKKGLKQIQLAELTKIPRDSISGYCKGENIPGNDRLKLIADALDIPPEDLIPRAADGGSDPKLTVFDQGDGRSWIQINRSVSSLLASEIQAMIHKEDAGLPWRSKS